MSLADVTMRIQQIQAQLASLSPPPQSTQPAVSSEFQAIVDRIQKGTGTTPNPPAADPAPTAPASPGVSAPPSTPSTPSAPSAPTGGQQAPTTPGGGGSTGAPGPSLSGKAVIDEAMKYLGVPYVWGGEDPSGMDCSGFIQYVYNKLGVELPRVSYEQATAGRAVDGLANARPGDILAFNSPVSHVGIYLGGNKMINAPRPGEVVRIEDVYDTPTAIRRVLPEASPSSIPAGTPYARLFQREGAEHGVQPALLAAIAKQESGYDPRAVSSAGAQGLMQLMPATAAGLGVGDSFDPAQAVDGAARLMKSLLAEFGRVDLALAAYNAGPGAVHRYDGIPPYPETQNYVTSVQAILESFGQAA